MTSSAAASADAGSVPGTISLATKEDASWGTCLDRLSRPNHREFGLRDVADAMRCESSLSRFTCGQITTESVCGAIVHGGLCNLDNTLSEEAALQ